MYVLNIIVAGQIAISSISNPANAAATTFGNAYPPSEVMRLVGCLWLAIAVLSALGLWRPMTFAPILLVQLIYKGTWLVIVALPAMRSGVDYPRAMAAFFIAWVVSLPFVIPWSAWVYGDS